MKLKLALLFAMLLAANAYALSFVHLATLNGNETGGPSFSRPAHIAFDSDGRAYIADPGNNRIVVYSSNLSYLTSRGGVLGNGITEMDGPTGIAIDQSGKLYIADTLNHRVIVYSGYTGSYVKAIATGGSEGYSLNRPEGVFVSSNGTVHIADTYKDRIELFSDSGMFITEIKGLEQFGDYVFNRPSGVFVDENNGWILVSDTQNNRVQVFDLGYNFIRRLGWGEGDEGFYAPAAAASDRLGRIYIADTGNNRVQVFSRNFAFLMSINGTEGGAASTGNSSFGSPRGIAIDSRDRLFISDNANNRVLVFQAVDVELERQYTENKIALVKSGYSSALSSISLAQAKIGKIIESGCTNAENPSALLNYGNARLEIANASLLKADLLFSQERYSEAAAEADGASSFISEANESAVSAASMVDSFIIASGEAVPSMTKVAEALGEVAELNATAHQLNASVLSPPALGSALSGYESAKQMCAAGNYDAASSAAQAALTDAMAARDAYRQGINIVVIPVYLGIRDEFLAAKANITLYDLPIDATPLEIEISYANTLILDSKYIEALQKLSAIRSNLTALQGRIALHWDLVEARRQTLRTEITYQGSRIPALEELAENYSQPFDSVSAVRLLAAAEANLSAGRLDDANNSIAELGSSLNMAEGALRAIAVKVDAAKAAIAQAESDISRAEAESIPLPLVGADLYGAKADLEAARSMLYTDPDAAKTAAESAGNAAVAEYNRVRGRKPWVVGGIILAFAVIFVLIIGMGTIAAGALAIMRHIRKRAKKLEKAAGDGIKDAEGKLMQMEEGLLGKKK